MFSFIRKHWVAYLIGIVIAIALGLGLAYFVGVKGSTPESIHVDEVAQETEDSSQDEDEVIAQEIENATEDQQ